MSACLFIMSIDFFKNTSTLDLEECLSHWITVVDKFNIEKKYNDRFLCDQAGGYENNIQSAYRELYYRYRSIVKDRK